MTWIPLLLADPSPCFRLLVLRELLGRSTDDPEVQETVALRETDPLVTDLLALQEPDGTWRGPDGVTRGEPIRSTSQALMRLGYLGFRADHPAVRRGAEALFSLQQADGSWPIPGGGPDPDEEGTSGGDDGYSMIPLQTAIPLRGLVACGCVTDPRAERAIAWLFAQRLPDGAWPTGIAAGNYGRVAGYRRLPHSRWGCRSNTTGALICLALHPEHRTGPEARRALDLLLGRETREGHTLGYEVARLIGAERARGFLTYYARFDLALILDLCWRVGASREEGRVAELVAFVRGLQGSHGLWTYAARPQASRWVTLDLLRSLSRLDAGAQEARAQDATDWSSSEPRTPFRAYAKKARRY